MTASKIALILVPAVIVAAAGGTVLGVRFQADIRQHLGLLPESMKAPATAISAPASADDKILYTCSMHRSIIRDQPGACPICGMPLEAIHTHGKGMPAATVQIDPILIQNMGIRTAPVQEGQIRQSIRAVGSLTEPEQAHVNINLRVSGWIQKLYANQEGMAVQEGDPLFDLYSPEVTAAADELIAVRKSLETTSAQPDPVLARSGETMLAAGKRKLQLLGLSAAQVEAIAKMDKAPATITISSPIHGHIAEKMVIEGASVKVGEELMKIADRTQMWLVLQVYEQQLGLVSIGQKVRAKVSAYPEQTFEGTVDFIYPHLDTATRTAMVRVVLPNTGHQLHENMYATAEIDAPLQAKSRLVPREAVIDTGRRQIVFLAEADGHFTPRDVSLGRSGRIAPSEPEVVEITSGLEMGDVVVTSGQFLLDSESRMQEALQKSQKISQDNTIEGNDNAPSASQTPMTNEQPGAGAPR